MRIHVYVEIKVRCHCMPNSLAQSNQSDPDKFISRFRHLLFVSTNRIRLLPVLSPSKTRSPRSLYLLSHSMAYDLSIFNNLSRKDGAAKQHRISVHPLALRDVPETSALRRSESYLPWAAVPIIESFEYPFQTYVNLSSVSPIPPSECHPVIGAVD